MSTFTLHTFFNQLKITTKIARDKRLFFNTVNLHKTLSKCILK